MALKLLKRTFAVMSEPVDLNVLQRPLERASVRPQDPITGPSPRPCAPCSLAPATTKLTDPFLLAYQDTCAMASAGTLPPRPSESLAKSHSLMISSRSHPGDQGKHTLSAVMSSTFLDFSKRQGNDLSTPRPEYGFPGLKEGACQLIWLSIALALTPRVTAGCLLDL